jgi:hypothetical protein
VDVEISGFKHLTRENIPVEVNNAARVDGTLQVGDLTQTVEVTSQAALLQTESATVSQVVEGRQVEDIPLNGRNIMNLLALTAGGILFGILVNRAVAFAGKNRPYCRQWPFETIT